MDRLYRGKEEEEEELCDRFSEFSIQRRTSPSFSQNNHLFLPNLSSQTNPQNPSLLENSFPRDYTPPTSQAIGLPPIQSPSITPDYLSSLGYYEINRAAAAELDRYMQLPDAMISPSRTADPRFFAPQLHAVDSAFELPNSDLGRLSHCCGCCSSTVKSVLERQWIKREFIRGSSNGIGRSGPHTDQRRYRDGSVSRLNNMSRQPQSQGYRNSQLLPAEYYSMNEFCGRMVAMAKDQSCCRLLQEKCEAGRLEDVNAIFLELKDYLSELMVDPFGNYLVQKLIEFCNDEQRLEMVLALTENEHELSSICLDTHGTRAVQKLLEHLTMPQQKSLIISALVPDASILTNDVNGHHVMLYCFKNFKEQTKHLTNAMLDHCVDVATNRHGCCVLQRCLEHTHGEQREQLASEITENALFLSENQYGNYVVQFLVEMKIPHFTTNVLRQLQGNFARLSLQKFSSNVVEKCLKESSEEEAALVIRELLPIAATLLQHCYGNYVMQSAFMVSKSPIRETIIDFVRKHLPVLRSHPFGKNIAALVNPRRQHVNVEGR